VGCPSAYADEVGACYVAPNMEIGPLRERLTKLQSRLEILRGHL